MKNDTQIVIDKFNEKYADSFTVEDYLEEVKRTYHPVYWETTAGDFCKCLDSIHCCLGMVDEYAEYIESVELNLPGEDILKELGDVMWYMANYCNFNSIHWEFVPVHVIELKYNYEFEKLAGLHKKELAYGKELDYDVLEKLISSAIRWIYHLCDKHDYYPSDVMRYNLKKLYLRYPDKFQSDLAINKNENLEKL